MSYVLLVEDSQSDADMVIRLLQSINLRAEHTTHGLNAQRSLLKSGLVRLIGFVLGLSQLFIQGFELSVGVEELRQGGCRYPAACCVVSSLAWMLGLQLANAEVLNTISLQVRKAIAHTVEEIAQCYPGGRSLEKNNPNSFINIYGKEK
jgi:hypothetical protein